MRNNRKMIIIIFIIILLLLSILSLILINYKKNDNDSQKFAETPFDMYEAYEKQRAKDGITADDARAYLEDNISEYYTIEGIIKSFNTYALYLTSTAKDLNLIVNQNNEQQVLEQYRKKGYEYINNVLAQNYKSTYSVNNQYIYEYITKNIGKKYTITDMYAVDDSDMINTYFVYGTYGSNEFNYIVILDKYNYTFEIYLSNYLSDNKINKTDSSTMKTQHISRIEKNDFNSFSYKNIEEEQMIRTYYDEYTEFMKSNPERAYNLLNSEYRDKRFNSIDEFKEYTSIKANDIANRKLSSYSINKIGNYTEITCKDNMDGNITFRVTSVMKYNVLLDSYTMNIALFEKEYNEEQNNSYKAKICFERFMECINGKDYKKAYSYLNNEYKERNFKTEQEFITYIERNWFDTNKYIYDTIQTSGQDYIINGSLIDSRKFESYDAEFLNKSFAIRLGSNYNTFEISFEK
ncbi:MAG: hypothetical protein J6B87_04055 [Clostridia bacterium]|nr:hypothetical protein [Clostridia bacterium]